ncbi:MAG: DUF2274 domain-containing protein [Sphingopyxis sp.]|nr:DUF2274 domain-containing protein [Sphingopyxis sp.]
MTQLKLPKLPDRTPVKLSIQIFPELAEALQQYAVAYEEAYGKAEPVCDLIPFMLSAFLESDRGFARTTRK